MAAIDLYEYSGFVTFQPLSQAQIEEIKRAMSDAGLEIDIGPAFMDLEYSGRDAGRKVLKALKRIAKIVLDANGEVECDFYDDHGVRHFEFLTITGGCLFRERGEIVRSDKQEL